MDYKSKYLKYKNKYNSLKTQIGGNNSLIIHKASDKSSQFSFTDKTTLKSFIDKINDLVSNPDFLKLIRNKTNGIIFNFLPIFETFLEKIKRYDPTKDSDKYIEDEEVTLRDEDYELFMDLLTNPIYNKYLKKQSPTSTSSTTHYDTRPATQGPRHVPMQAREQALPVNQEIRDTQFSSARVRPIGPDGPIYPLQQYTQFSSFYPPTASSTIVQSQQQHNENQEITPTSYAVVRPTDSVRSIIDLLPQFNITSNTNEQPQAPTPSAVVRLKPDTQPPSSAVVTLKPDRSRINLPQQPSTTLANSSTTVQSGPAESSTTVEPHFEYIKFLKNQNQNQNQVTELPPPLIKPLPQQPIKPSKYIDFNGDTINEPSRATVR